MQSPRQRDCAEVCLYVFANFKEYKEWRDNRADDETENDDSEDDDFEDELEKDYGGQEGHHSDFEYIFKN